MTSITPDNQNKDDQSMIIERFQLLIDSLTDACFGIDFSWRYIFFNSTAEMLAGLKREEVLGKDIRKLFPDIVNSTIFKEYQSVMENRTARKVVGFLTFPDGRKGQFSVNITPIPEGIMCLVKEVDDRVLLLDELKESEAFLMGLFNAPHDQPILVTDPHDHIAFTNDAAGRLFGHRRQELAGQHINLLIPVEAWTGLLSHEKSGTMEEQTNEALLPRRDGSLFPGLLHTYPVYNRVGTLMARITYVRDLTIQKEMETRRLQGARFNAIAELTTDVAHNFNNLLGSIMGCAQMLQARVRDSNDPRAARLIDQILQSGERMTRLVQDMLTFTGIMDIMDGQVTKTYDNLDTLIKEAISYVQPMLTQRMQEKKIRIRIEYKPVEFPPLQYLTKNVRSAFVQILLNAIEAMDESGVIEVKGSWPVTETAGLDRALVQIIDQGRGMDEHTLRRAVEPLFSTKKRVGVGIGLTTAYGVITRLGGSLDLKSEPGKGTTVSVWLP